MDPLNQQALSSLDGVLTSLIPEVGDADLQPVLSINPTRIRPAWMGGFIGLHDDPQGELLARRIEATASITVKADDEADLPAAVSDLTQAILSADRAQLVQQGLFTLTRTGEGPISSTGRGGNRISQRDVMFDVLFEFIKVPEEAEGIIDNIPLEMDVIVDSVAAAARPAPGPVPASSVLINTDFATDPLSLFTVVDDPEATQSAPSEWLYNEAESRIEQTTNIRGGGYQPTVRKAGTYLLLNTTAEIPTVRNFNFETLFQASDVDGIGMVFRWQDVDNFYYFLMSARNSYRLMGKKLAGSFEFLTEHALDESGGFTPDAQQRLRLSVTDNVFQAYLDDVLVLQGTDSSLPDAGQVGFMCHGNNGAAFYEISLETA